MKWFTFTILTWIVVVLSFPSAGISAIAYTDFQDITTHSSEYFDLDSNGVYDIGVVWDYDSYADDTSAEASLPVGAPQDNGFAASGALALRLDDGALIGTGRDFRSDTVMLSRYWDDWDWDYYTWGQWDNMSEDETAYLGFRFLDDDDVLHYGWIQARVDPSNQYITLYDLAWETSAGQAITAGDTGAAAVPVPAAVWLLGSGLFTLNIDRRKK